MLGQSFGFLRSIRRIQLGWSSIDIRVVITDVFRQKWPFGRPFHPSVRFHHLDDLVHMLLPRECCFTRGRVYTTSVRGKTPFAQTRAVSAPHPHGCGILFFYFISFVWTRAVSAQMQNFYLFIYFIFSYPRGCRRGILYFFYFIFFILFYFLVYTDTTSVRADGPRVHVDAARIRTDMLGSVRTRRFIQEVTLKRKLQCV
jgi:hypothetical protein